MNSPLVSIVMPSLNQARFIEASIDSVLGQDYPNLELIVADGASTDGTQALLQLKAQADSRLRWFSQPDTGPAQAVNSALAQVRGTIIGWLNSDDLYAPGAVQRAATAFADAPQLLMVYGHGEHIDVAGAIINRYPTLQPQTPIASFAEGCFICQPTVFFRRTQLLLLGKLDESLACSFDFEYWLRAFAAFPDRIGFVDHVQAYSRLHADCLTLRLRQRVALEGMEILHRHLGSAPKEWLLTYAEELLADPAQAAGIASLEQHFEELLARSRPWIGEGGVMEARVRITELLAGNCGVQ